MFSVQKFPVNATIPFSEEKRYMGICVPQTLTNLFPNLILSPIKRCTSGDVSQNSIPIPTMNTKSIKHDTEKCFHCSRKMENKEIYFQEKKGNYLLHNNVINK